MEWSEDRFASIQEQETSVPWRDTAIAQKGLHSFFTLALDGDEWSTSHLAILRTERIPVPIE